MSDLRTSLIRLAHLNPELRSQLLPLISRTAGNLGEELNPYQLDFDKVPTSDEDMEEAEENLYGASNDLQGIVEDTSFAVGALVSKALHASRKFSKFFGPDSAQEFREDLIAAVVSAAHRAK